MAQVGRSVTLTPVSAKGYPVGSASCRATHSDLEVRTVWRLRDERNWGACRIAAAMQVSRSWVRKILECAIRLTPAAYRDDTAVARLAAAGHGRRVVAKRLAVSERYAGQVIRKMRLMTRQTKGYSDEQRG